MSVGAGARITAVHVPEEIPKRAVREPRFHLSDVRTIFAFCVLGVFLVLLSVKIFECLRVCIDMRDWDQDLEPFVTAGILGIGSVIGYFFGRKHDD